MLGAHPAARVSVLTRLTGNELSRLLLKVLSAVEVDLRINDDPRPVDPEARWYARDIVQIPN